MTILVLLGNTVINKQNFLFYYTGVPFNHSSLISYISYVVFMVENIFKQNLQEKRQNLFKISSISFLSRWRNGKTREGSL